MLLATKMIGAKSRFVRDFVLFECPRSLHTNLAEPNANTLSVAQQRRKTEYLTTLTLFSETRGTRGAPPFPLPCPALPPLPEDPDPGLLPAAAATTPEPGLAMPNVEQWTKPS